VEVAIVVQQPVLPKSLEIHLTRDFLHGILELRDLQLLGKPSNTWTTHDSGPFMEFLRVENPTCAQIESYDKTMMQRLVTY
jgi:hypothetical protein